MKTDQDLSLKKITLKLDMLMDLWNKFSRKVILLISGTLSLKHKVFMHDKNLSPLTNNIRDYFAT